uniref:Uncharacterized protein n=1 Tax=Candidatus Kentrum sp. TC TaxID=2126339 RepID=A0A450ZQL5_9GAMM|nr:MAG: hypothetical protein BECKTC1821F_GA0114240_10093 [Candidatus Kentron sp. TC]
MNLAGILRQRSLPGNGQRQKQRIQPGQIEALADIFAGGHDNLGFRELFVGDFALPGAHGPAQYDDVESSPGEQFREALGVFPSLRQNQGMAFGLDTCRNVVDDPKVTLAVLHQPAAYLGDAWRIGKVGRLIAQPVDDDRLVESGFVFRPDFMTDGSRQHEHDLLVAVLPVGRGGQAQDILCAHLVQRHLEAWGQDVVAFIDDDLSVLSDER